MGVVFLFSRNYEFTVVDDCLSGPPEASRWCNPFEYIFKIVGVPLFPSLSVCLSACLSGLIMHSFTAHPAWRGFPV